MVEFENEFTWGNAVSKNTTDEFHELFEKAIIQTKSVFGKKYPIIIDGKKVFSDDCFKVRSPADTNLILAEFPNGTEENVNNAANSAKSAFYEWSNTSYQDRVKIFRNCADSMSRQKFDLAALMTFENGKNRIEAMNDVDEAIDFLRFYSYQLEKNEGFCKKTPHPNPNEKTMTVLKPYGVWGIIAPFNFPSAIAIGMTAGAVITGNTAVLKPSSATPISSYFFVEKLFEHVPDGTINFVTGDGKTVGRSLVENANIEGIAFTGSRDVGIAGIRKFTENNTKPFIAEMGGKNPVIVTKNADLEKAAEGVMRAAFGYGGQKCSACSRVYVQKEILNDFTEKILEKTKSLKVGKPWLRESFLGPVINKDSVDKFENAVNLAKKDGKVVCGGNILKDSDYEYGFFVEPTIVTNLPKNHKLITEELFLPFLCIETYDDFNEAIELANNTEYGLTAGIFSEDKQQIDEFFRKIHAGTVYANRASSATTAALVQAQPFVGWKASGTTGKGAGGENYLQQFLRAQTQTLCD